MPRMTGKIRVEIARQQAPSPPRPRLARPCERSARRSGHRASRAAEAGSVAEGSTRSPIPPSRFCCQSASVRPVDRTTSSARAMRALSAGFSRAAASGIELARARARFSSTGASRTCRRTSGSIVGHRCDPVEQGAQIEARPADQDRKSALRMDVGDLAPRHRRPIGRGAGQGAIEHAVKPVLGPRAFVGRRRRAEDRQVAIDLRAVGVDDHAAGPFGERERKCRLAACRRSGD